MSAKEDSSVSVVLIDRNGFNRYEPSVPVGEMEIKLILKDHQGRKVLRTFGYGGEKLLGKDVYREIV